MFQKLKQKLKSNKLIRKILSFFTIFVVLCSMLVIPSSAADDSITDLTDTTWEIQSGWSVMAGYGSFSIDYTLVTDTDEYSYCRCLTLGYNLNSNSSANTITDIDLDGLPSMYDFTVTPTTSFTITITGGADSDDPDLISWVTENGKQILPNHVEPITNVFTDITTWITSALGSVTGVFYGSTTETVTVPVTVSTIGEAFYSAGGSTSGDPLPGRWYLVTGFPDLADGTEFTLSYDFYYEDPVGAFDHFEDSLTYPFGSQIGLSSGGLITDPYNSSGEKVVVFSDSGSEMEDVTVSYVVSSEPSLTFLGTLAVVGVGLAIIFLFIGVITNFLKNRG